MAAKVKIAELRETVSNDARVNYSTFRIQEFGGGIRYRLTIQIPDIEAQGAKPGRYLCLSVDITGREPD
jgi:hypothetical protein